MNKDSQLIYEGYKSGRKIHRVTIRDYYGVKETIHIGDYVTVIDAFQDDLIGKSGPVEEIIGVKGSYRGHYQFKVKGLGLVDETGIQLNKSINKFNLKDRDTVNSILDL